MVKYNCDVVIIGSGTGGAGAGYFCAAAGLDTIIVEANDGFGSAIAGNPDSKTLTGVNGIFAVESRYQNSKHIRTTKKQVFNFLMEHANWRVPAWQAAALAGRSGAIWNWLEDMGCEAEEAVAYNWTSEHTWLYFNDKKPRLEVIGAAFLKAGGKLLSSAIFEDIIMEAGRAAGVKGKMYGTDEPFVIGAKAVVLAFGEPQGGAPGGPPPDDGGEELPAAMPMFGPVIPKPDGFVIAEKAGCIRAEDTYSAMNQLAKPMGIGGPEDPNEPQEAYIRQPESLALNLDCQRFTTEEILGTMEDGASAIAVQPQGTAFILFSSSINDHFCKNGFTSYKYRYGNEGPAYKDIEERFAASIKAGFGSCVFMADSLEALAGKLGFDPEKLSAAVTDYNKCCANGRDPYFFKDSRFLIPLTGPKYFAMKCAASLGKNPGVLKSTSRLELVGSGGKPIAGLYGSGGCISFLNGSIYTHHCAGSRSTFGLVCGQMLGELVPEYVKSCK